MRLLAAALLASLAVPASAAPPAPPADRTCRGDLCINFVDLTPRFLAFQAAARDEADPARRFVLWQEHYGFAAVPPGPKGQEMARGLLDKAWRRYSAALPAIRDGAARMQADVLADLVRVAGRLGQAQPLDVRVTAYVGGFEDNAFTAGTAERPAVFLPVESSVEERRLLEQHELTHAVHLRTAALSGGWERSIAQTMLQEGLAMRVVQALNPALPPARYVSHRPGWLDEATAKRAAILADVAPVLAAKDGETVWRYTIDRGPAGIEREAYAAGWFVVGHMLDRGMTLAEIARIPEAEMTARVAQAIAEMQGAR